MASILECSVPTIQAIELGKLNLSIDLAQRVHFQTAINIEWLLGNDVSEPPVTSLGEPYTKECFEKMQASLLSPKSKGSDTLFDFWIDRKMFMKHVKILSLLYAEAYKIGKVPIFFYKGLMSTKEICGKVIPEHPEIAEKLKALTYSELGPVDLFELTEDLEQFERDTNEELRRKLKQAKEPLPDFLKKFVPGHAKRPAPARKKK